MLILFFSNSRVLVFFLTGMRKDAWESYWPIRE